MNIFTKQKRTRRLREQTYGYWGEGWREGIVKEFGIGMYTLLYLKRITNKVLLYSTGSYIQYPVINHNGKDCTKECIYMYN